MATKRLENKAQICVEVLSREKEDCTFTPKVNNGRATRSKETFLSAQQEFLDKKKEKIAKLKEERERIADTIEQSSHKPEVNNRSERLASKTRKGKPVHEILY